MQFSRYYYLINKHLLLLLLSSSLLHMVAYVKALKDKEQICCTNSLSPILVFSRN